MIRSQALWKYPVAAAVVLLAAALAVPARALDAYQDRRGIFSGIGLGGGGAFPVNGDDPGGAVLLDFQIGGGATQNLTFDFDIDLTFQLLDARKDLLVTPGPELNYFFGKTGLFVRAGIGMALDFGWIDAPRDVPNFDRKEESDFRIGFEAAAGLGWEFFANANLAVGLWVEGDYVVLPDDDVAGVTFAVTLKYY